MKETHAIMKNAVFWDMALTLVSRARIFLP
jgi:hypothetical protein